MHYDKNTEGIENGKVTAFVNKVEANGPISHKQKSSAFTVLYGNMFIVCCIGEDSLKKLQTKLDLSYIEQIENRVKILTYVYDSLFKAKTYRRR